MARPERWKSSEVARWEIPCFIQGWHQGFIFLFLMLINKMKEHDVFKIFLRCRGWKDFPSLDLTQAVRNVTGCGSVWISRSQNDLRWELVTCGRPVHLVVAEFSTYVLWPLTIWLMVILWVIMLWFHYVMGMEFKDKIVLYCRDVSRESLQGFDNSYIMC